MPIKIKKIILLLGDVITFYLSLYLTLLARYGYPVEANNWDRHALAFSLVFFVWLVVFFISDLYDLKTSYNSSNLFAILVKIFLINSAIAVAIFYFFGQFIETIRPQRVLIIHLIINLILIFAWRRLFFLILNQSQNLNQVLIIGRTELSQKLHEQINNRKQLGYAARIIDTIPEDLASYCRDHKIDILINADENYSETEGHKIFACLSLGIDVYKINTFYEIITNTVPIEDIDHAWFLENLTEHSKKFYEIIKRIIDITFSITGLVITLPLLPVIAAIIKLEGPGPIIFKQYRTGKNGKRFLAMKFRSMVQDAEKNGPQWANKNDPRVTRFGRLMRKTRLDEIPQLINILRGEMSLIGPRPERPEFVEILKQEIPFYQERLLIKPGLTGWAQLYGPAYGGSKEESLEKLRYDLYYIKNRSLILDFIIILKTIKVVLSRKGQ